MRVLVIDDDEMVTRWVSKVLREADYMVSEAGGAGSGQRLALSTDYDLVMVDLDLPDGSGLSVVEAIRRAGKTMPIVIMTGRADDDGIVAGLDAGADDYLVKPVPNGVLRARVRAAIRRGGAVQMDELSNGDLVLNRRRREVRVGKTTLNLTPKEYALLEYLMLRPGEVAPRSDLLERVWGVPFDTDTNVVDTTMSRLRQKVEAATDVTRIVTVRGVGFTLEGSEAR